MKEKMVNQHKRLAMGDTVKGYAKGGTIASDVRGVAVRSSGGKNPITTAKRNNGVPGYKAGGKKC